MTDPTKYVRKLYADALSGILTIYDGMAPADASGIYGVIDTSWTLEPATKRCTIFRFQVNLEITEEFKEYGSSVNVDNKCDAIIAIMCPQDVTQLPTMSGGYSQQEVKIPAISNDAFQNDAFAIWRKKIQLIHIIS